MMLPSHEDVAASGIVVLPNSTYYATFQISDEGPKPNGGWSSLIGIVTAICGNILISVALNTQRYAHIRLHERWVEKRKALKAAQKRLARTGYGTQDGAASKERTRAKLRRAHTEGQRPRDRTPSSGEEDGEAAPLLSSASYDTNGDVSDNPDPGPEEHLDHGSEKSYLRSPLWWAGQIMMTIGEAGNFLAYGFAPASIVSPLGVVALISNCIIAPLFLKEPFRSRDFFGVVIAITGAVTVALSASNNNPKFGPHEIWGLISTWEFETYLGITCFAIICLLYASNKYGPKSIFIDLGLVGLFGAYTALSTKGVASLLSYKLFKVLAIPLTYLLAAILVFTAVMQIKYLNRALRRFDATQVIPTQFVLFTLSVILGSAVLYRDFERTSRDDAVKFVGGCTLTFVGVWLITSARPRETDEEEGFDEDDEAINLAQNETYHDEVPSSATNMRQHALASTSHLPNGHRSPYRRRSLAEGTPSSRRQSRQIPLPSTPTPIVAGPTSSTPSEPPSIPSTYQESSPLTENPWVHPDSKARQAMRRLLQPMASIWPHESPETLPHPLPESSSTPVLPSEARIQLPRPPTPRNQSDAREQPTTPVAPYTADGTHLLSRSSLSTLVPGPLGGTLSTPLSAIVADSLRRGVDVSSIRPRRRRRIKLPDMPWNAQLRRRGNSETDVRHVASARDYLRDLYAQSPSSERRPLQNGVGAENGAEEAGRASRSRARSFSNALVDLFSRKRPRLGSTADEAVDSSEPPTPATGPSASVR